MLIVHYSFVPAKLFINEGTVKCYQSIWWHFKKRNHSLK